MAKIARVEIFLVAIEPKTVRTDSIQAFVRQETPIVRITDTDGAQGVGYAYTIGTGGSSVIALLSDHLCPLLVGLEAEETERIWRKLKYHTHATTVGAITSLALAAIDVALWDLKARRAKLPLHKLLGGANDKAKVYSTEGGWLHLRKEELVEQSLRAKEEGFAGVKLKLGLPDMREDARRIEAVREAVGDSFEIMTDCNQSLTLDRATRLCHLLADTNIAWIEEPFLADDIKSHILLSRATSTPVAVGESLYSLGQFREYLDQDACAIVQVDVARVGGVTPWLKTAHLTEAFNRALCPHFLMEIHAPLVCAVPNGAWVEYIPQLDELTTAVLEIRDGHIFPSNEPGVGIAWDWQKIEAAALYRRTI